MAGMTGVLAADFAAFNTAVEGTLVKLKGFETGAEKVSAQMTRMANSFSGQKIIADATMMTKVINDAGGASKLTAAEMASVNAKVTEAIAKYKALGGTAPQAMQDLANATKNTDTAGRDWSSMLGKASGLLASLGIGLSIGAVVSFGKALIAGADALNDLSAKTGVSLDQLQRWAFVGAQAGVSTDEFADASFKLGVKLAGGSGSVRDAVEKLGLSYEALRNQSPDEQFNSIVAALERMEDPQERNRLGVELFGKSFATIAPAVAKGYTDMARQAEVSSDTQIKAIGQASDAWDRFYANQKTNITSALGDAVIRFQTFAKLTLGEQAKVVAASFVGVDAMQKYADAAKAQAAAASAGVPVQKRQTAATIDYTAELVKVKGEVGRLTVAQRDGINAAQRLGKSTEDITNAYGISEGALKLFKEQTDKHKSSQEKATSAVEDHRKKLDAVNRIIQDATRDTGNLTDAQKASIEKYEQFNLTNEQLATKLGISSKAIQDFKNDVKLAAERFDDFIEGMQLGREAAEKLAPKLGGIGFKMVREDITLLKEPVREFYDGLGKIETTVSALVTGSLTKMPGEVARNTEQFKQANQSTNDWSDALSTLSNDFVQMAQIGGDSFGGLSRTVGMAVATFKLFKDGTAALSKALNDVSTAGGRTATNYVAVAASMTTVATAMWTVVAATLAYWDAENKRDNAAQQAKTLQNGFNAAFGTSFGLTVNMTRAIEDLTARYKDYVNVRLGLKFKEEEAEALLMTEIIRDLGGAAALTAKHLDFIKTDSIGRLLDMINQGGPLAVQAMQSLQALFDELVPGLDDITAAAERYGLTLDDLGPKVKQMSIDKTAAQIAKDFEMLVNAGVPFETLMRDIITRTTESGENFEKMSKDAQDAYLKAGGVVNVSTTGMHSQIQNLVKDALRLGLTLPESMKPIIDQLIEAGLLVDDTGEKMTDMSELTFTKPLEKMVDDLIKKLDQLISKFIDVGNTKVKPVHVPVTVDPLPKQFLPPDLDLSIVDGAATGGLVTRHGIQHFSGGGTVLNFRPLGTDTVPAMLTPGEMVLTPAQQRQAFNRGGGGDNTAILAEFRAMRADQARRDARLNEAVAKAVKNELQKVGGRRR